MNTYEFNKEALSVNYPDLVKALEGLKDDKTCRVVATKLPKSPTLEVTVGETKWLLHSKEDPRKEAYAFIDTVLKQNVEFANIVVVLGVGMGYHLEPLFARYSTQQTLFIIVESNPQIFKKFIQNNRPSVTAPTGGTSSVFTYPGLFLMVGVHPEQVYNQMFEIMMKLGKNAHSSFVFVEHPVLIRFNKDYYKPFCEQLQRVCYDIRSSYGNDPEDSWIGIDHMLQNLDTISSVPGIIQAKDKFKGVPAVIVATGPSLNKNIDLLPEIKDKAVFFAADASLNTFLLHEPQIVPDIVCSLERNLSTANHFKQIKDKSSMKDIWLCACPVVMPDVYKAWEGKDVTLYRDFAHFTWLGIDKGKLNTGKSVTNMAFKAALYLGCNPIVLVGQDLAFAPNGQTHVKGADHAREGLKESQLIQQKVKVMGNSGEMIDSLDTWLGMLKRFEYDISKCCKDVTVINATEGGAKITGTEIKTLREVIDQYCQKDHHIRHNLNEYLQYPDTFDQHADEETMEKNIISGIEWLKESLQESEEAISTIEEACEFVMDEHTPEEIDAIFVYCDKIRQKILTHKMCYLTAMHVLQSWCMGRENVFMSIPRFYASKELQVDRLIKLFEFFYGLQKLFKMIIEGVEKDYDEWKIRRSPVLQELSGGTDFGEPKAFSQEKERLDMQPMQQQAVEGDKNEGIDGGGI